MTENPVHFGTDGWRAIIAETFTFENVMACAQAAADHFAATYGKGQPMVVGYDTRFLSDEFALSVARVLAGNGFRVQLANRPAPTPALSYRIIETQACGGIVVTSSHNPFRWNGIKVKPHYGGSASPEFVAEIERRVPAILATPGAVKLAPSTAESIERFDPLPGYLATLGEKVDIQRIKAAGLRVAVDPMYGSGAGLFEELLAGGKSTVTEIHSERNPAFPGIRAPEPIESNLGEFMHLMASRRYDIGIANDGDADRVGLVDEKGNYVDQLRAFALLVNYMLGERGLRGPIVKSVTTTNMAALLAKHYGVDLFETPVGFKHIGPLMMEKDALIGGEESGGYGFRGHLPERDGILAGLYLLDYAAATGKPPSELLERVFQITGPHYYERIDIELEPGSNERFKANLDAARPGEIAGRPVRSSDRTDGWRFFIDEGWLLFRLSGTEPLLRIYTEVTASTLVRPVLDAGRQIAGLA
ncbi:MAG: phosphoglucomutase/phosphomannomutase family protein [Dehalococcoidia bacterium]|uniref:phosphoglucomutase/phosphomannomutase family protein n=1 Tax=Candidatus Amarobacter glycogenicus TaxID=3140699 RepID=UPI002A16EEF5|nr:phosphoglucomutase/phosphomannomutase family protein [Dehalococcoidia bacterium]MBK9612289.1 phosphoglucomutase/phosphomannomutase family protein [Dehalococcoidia bacterium]